MSGSPLLLPVRTVEPSAGAAMPTAAGRGTTGGRVLMVTYDFPPSATMGAQACAQLARHLPRYGWTPIVLTVDEQHLEDHDRATRLAPPETVVRTGMIPHPLTIYRHLKARLRRRADGRPGGGEASPEKTGTLRRWILSVLWMPDPYAGWIPPAVSAGLRAIRAHRVSHIFSSAPHSTNHLVGLVLARLTGLPWTAHFRDPWTYPRAMWEHAKPVSALSAGIDTALERAVVRRADAVVCVTDPHTNWLRERYPDVPRRKFVTIPNGFDGAEWDAALPADADGARPASHDAFVICYAGTLYNRRSPLPLFRAVSSLIQAGEVAPERIRIDLIGRCDVADGASVREMAAAWGLDARVNVTGPLGRAEALRRVARSDLLLLLAEELVYQIPGKTYEYLRAGRSILALTSEGALVDLLRRTGGAWVVDPADEAGVAAAVREAYRLWQAGLPGPRPDQDIVAGFDRRLLAGRLADVFETPSCAASPAP